MMADPAFFSLGGAGLVQTTAGGGNPAKGIRGCMDQGDVTTDFHPRALPRSQEGFYLSWVAYVRPLVLFLALATLGLIVSQSARDADFILAGYGILFIGIIKVVYDIAWRRRLRLYTDRNGVWVARGFLPGKRGVSGMAWRDIDEAACESGLFGWLTRSYRICVYQREPASGDLVIDHIKHGHLVVAAINERLLQALVD